MSDRLYVNGIGEVWEMRAFVSRLRLPLPRSLAAGRVGDALSRFGLLGLRPERVATVS